MADVTITEFYNDPDYFNDRTNPGYLYGGVGGGVAPGAGLTLTGGVDNRIVTATGPSSLEGEEFFLYDDSTFTVKLGTMSPPYGGSTYTMSIGSSTNTEYGGLELIGARTSGDSERVGSVSFHNTYANNADKLIADIYAKRWQDDDAGKLFFDVVDLDQNQTTELTIETDLVEVSSVLTAADVLVGSISPYADADHTVTVGSTILDEYGGLELISNRASDAIVGGVSFHNTTAAQSDKKIANIYALRYGANSATVKVDVASLSGSSMNTVWIANNAAQAWGIDGTTIMDMTSAGVVPGSDATYYLGWTSLRWLGIYGQDLGLTGDITLEGFIYFTDTNTSIGEDSGSNLTFTDAVAGTVTLSDLSLWTLNGTDISPATPGNDILLDVNTGFLKFGDGDTFIYEDSDDDLRIAVSSSPKMVFTTTFIGTYEHFIPIITKTYDLGTSALWWRYLYADRHYIQSTHTYIAETGGTDMYFVSSDAGAVYLNDIKASMVWYLDAGVIKPKVAGTDVLLGTTEYLYFGDSSTRLYATAPGALTLTVGNTVKMTLTSAEIRVYDDITPNSSNIDLGSTTEPWRYLWCSSIFFLTSSYRIGTSGTDMYFISPDAGVVYLADIESHWEADSVIAYAYRLSDNNGDILLPTSSNTLKFGDGDSYIYENSDDVIRIVCSNSTQMAFDASLGIISSKTLYPSYSKSRDLGTSTYWWNDVFVDRLYIDDTATYLDIDTGDMTFTDTNSGTVTLADLIAGGYVHPNHSGQVTSIADGAQTLDVTAVTAQTASTGISATDTFIVADTGALAEATITQLETYMQANLSFGGSYTHPNHSGHVTSVGDGAQTLVVAAITGQTELASGLASTDELLVSDAGVIKRMDVSVIEAYMQANLSFGGSYTHPNHSGQVTSVGDGAQVLDVTAITDQTELASGLASADELLVSDGGVLKRMDISVIEAYMNAELNFNLYVHPNHSGHVTSTADGATVVTVSSITGQTLMASTLLSTDELLLNDGGVIKRMAIDTIETYMNDNCTFNLYVHPNHSGQVDSVADTTLSLNVTAISAQTELTTGLVSTDELMVNDGGALKRMDISVLEAYMQSNLSFGGAGYWGKAGTDLSPATPGDDILLASGNELLKFGDGDTYIYEVADDQLAVVIANTVRLLIQSTDLTTYASVIPAGTKTYDLGRTDRFWDNVYVDRLYVDNVNTYIDISGSDMTFTSPTSGTVTLASLAASGVWTKTSTNLSPSTPGDDILLAVSDERILFGDADTYIYEASDDVLTIVSGTVSVLTFQPALISSYVTFSPYGSKLASLGSSSYFWDNVYVDRLYIDNTATYLDVSGSNMTFTDGATGTKTLAELATGYTHPNHSGHVSSVADGPTTLLVAAITGQTEMVYALLSTDEFLISDGGVIKKMNTSYLQTYMQNNLSFGGTGYWTRTGTDLLPSTAGDDLLLGTNELIKWGDGDTYMYESSDDNLRIVVNSGTRMLWSATAVTVYSPLLPSSSLALDIGSSSLYWDELFIDRIYINTTAMYIDNSGSELSFTDSITGTKTLSQLAANTVYVHPNHSGQVTSLADTSTALTVSAITAQTAVTSGLDSNDELIVAYDGLLRRMDVSVIQAYMQSALSFTTPYVHPNHSGHVSSSADGPTTLLVASITGQTAGTSIANTDEFLYSDGGVIKRIDASYLRAYAITAHGNHTGHVSSSGFTTTLLVAAITGQTALTSGLGSADELLISDSGVIKRMDVSVLQTYMQSNLSFGSSSPWTDGGTYLYPTGGEDVRPSTHKGADLGTSSYFWDNVYLDRAYVYDTGNFISGSSSAIYLYVDGGLVFTATATVFQVNKDITSGGTKAYDLGSSGNWWDNVYVDRLYIDNTSVYIDVSGTDMTFRDGSNTTPVTLSSLVSGGSSVWLRNASSSYVYPATSGDNVWVNVGSAFYLGATNSKIEATSTSSMRFYVGGVNRLFIGNGDVSLENSNLLCGLNGTLGDSTHFWYGAFIDRVYIDNTSVYLDVSGTQMTLTDSVVGTQTLFEVQNGGSSVSYTSLTTYTPAAGTRFVNIDVVGYVGTINVDLDNMQYSGNDGLVFVSYTIVSTGSTVVVNIRDSSNSTLRTANSSGTTEGGWLFMWDDRENRWNSAVLTAH